MLDTRGWVNGLSRNRPRVARLFTRGLPLGRFFTLQHALFIIPQFFQSFFERFPRALEQPYRLTLSDPIDGFPGAGPGAVIVAQDRAVVRCAHRMGGQTEAVPLEDVLLVCLERHR